VLYEDADWLAQQQVIALNLLVPMQITHALLPYFKQQPQAIVMTIGSVFGAIGYPSQAAYCASKAGLQRFSEALRRECYGSSVKVFHCMPRAIDTGLNSGVMSRLNRQLGTAIDQPQWVAEKICQQLQQGQPQRVLGWPERLLVPLNMLLPKLVDSALRKPYQLVSQLLKEHSS
jgi:short-subunit dehydrogenase